MRKAHRTRALLKFLTAMTTLGVAAALAILSNRDRLTSERAAEVELGGMLRLVAEHARASLQTNSIQLRRVIDLIGDRPLDALRGSLADWQALVRIRDDLPGADSLWIFDDNADLVLSTDAPSGVTVNVGDRGYFKGARDNTDDVFVSPMIWGRLRGGYHFAGSAAIRGAADGFRGVAQSSIDAVHFGQFFEDIHPGEGAMFALTKTDGSFVMRWPLPEPPKTGREPPPVATVLKQHIAKSPSGVYRSVSVVDGIERLYAYAPVPGTDLIAVVGRPTAVLDREWHERVGSQIALTLAALAAFLTVAGMAMHSARRLEGALADKETLFQEIHHRVKNNLQIISSLLTMQMLRSQEPEAKIVLQEAMSRIHTMGLVHHTLYLQNEASAVDLPVYLEVLGQRLAENYDTEARGICVAVSADETTFDLERAIPLALAANEAITNALKHAFPDGRHGTIRIDFRRHGDDCALSIADDGVGCDAKTRQGSIGFQLMSNLAKQIGGNVEIDGSAGTSVRFTFPARSI